MKAQFVDLFDKEKYGVNYLAAITLFLGLVAGWCVEGGQLTYNSLQSHARFFDPSGNEVTWTRFLWISLQATLVFSAGFAAITIAAAHVVKKDYQLPIVAGLGLAAWGILVRAVGLSAPAVFDPRVLLMNFLWPVLVLGGVVLWFRVMRNELEALLSGFVVGGLLQAVLLSLLWPISLAEVGKTAVMNMLGGFVAAVALYAGVSHHLEARGVGFGEYGLFAASETSSVGTAGGPLGKTRKPLTTMLLMAVTLNLYILWWIHKAYSEIRARAPEATSITPGRAVGFLFIPLFNFVWAILLFLDLPRAIERMEGSDPPPGEKPGRWIVSSLLIGGQAAGIIGGYVWTWALLLNVVFLWGGVLMAQSALNSHWRAHRMASLAA